MTKKLYEITFKLDSQAGKEPKDQGILHQNEQNEDQQTNTPGPTCQHTRTNMPTHKDQPKLREKKTRIINKQDILILP